MQFLLILCYPLLVHVAVLVEQPSLKILALVFLAAGILYRQLIAKNLLVLGVFSSIVGLFLLAGYFDLSNYILYMPPIIIPLILATVFGRSLFPGQIPLVTDIGEKSRGPLSEDMRVYTRRVTIMWTIFLSVLVAMAIMLPVFATETVWSLFTNILSYLIVGVLFLAEYVYRKVRFPDHDHPNFLQYIHIVIQSNINKN